MEFSSDIGKKRSFAFMDDQRSITHILKRVSETPDALQEVLPMVYDELRRLASHFLKSERSDHTLMATELVHEAYVRLFGLEEVSFNNRKHFFAMAAVAMRRILVDHERRRRAGKRISSKDLIPLEASFELPEVSSKVDMLALDRALEKLERLSPRQEKVIELRFFCGLTESQIADILDVSRPTIARDIRSAKLWLKREMS